MAGDEVSQNPMECRDFAVGSVIRAEVVVDPSRRNDLSRKSVLITGSDCYQQLYSLGELDPRLGGGHQVIVAFLRDDALMDEGEGMARIINSGDKAGARRVRNITHIRVLTPPLQ